MQTESARDISLDEISASVGLSKYYFAREFHRTTGYSFVSYLNLIRCKKAKKMIAETELSIGEIAQKCGFSNLSYFSRTFRSIVGILPNDYRKKQKTQ
ncbi:MAG: helix-turn-helix transcriptional regulator [Clostridia bacterium]|nr:helix-turn-helix transcriptional regulator [Clostridia bacterium]